MSKDSKKNNKKSIEKRRKYAKAYGKKHRKEINEHRRKSYKQNRTRLRKREKERRIEKRNRVFEHYCKGKSRCMCKGNCPFGKKADPRFLSIDHENGRKKGDLNVGPVLINYLIKHNFPKGYQILCFNCNCAKGHYGKCPHIK